MELGNIETSVLETKKPKLIKFSVRLMCIQSESRPWILQMDPVFPNGQVQVSVTSISYLGMANNIKTVFQQLPSFIAKSYALIAKLHSILLGAWECLLVFM